MSLPFNQIQREKIPEVQIVRAIAIIGVLCVHATSFSTLYMKWSNYYWLYNLINIFMKYGTPTFIFLSSFVLFYNYYLPPLNRQVIGKFYKKRLIYIIVPYIIFSIIYFALKQHYYYDADRSLSVILQDFLTKLAMGKAYTHLYFVFINMQFYLLFPLILLLFKRVPSLVKWALPAGLLIQWAFIIANQYGMHLPNRMSWAPSYASHYLLGAVMGIHYPKLKQWLIICKEHATPKRIVVWITLAVIWLAAGISNVTVYYNLRLYNVKYHPFVFDALWGIYTLVGTVILMQLAFLIYRNWSALIIRPLERLAGLSFGIYLIHPLFLFFYREYPPKTGVSWVIHLWYAGGFVVALFGSWLVVGLAARYMPGAALLFGQLPKVRKSSARLSDSSEKAAT